MMKRFFQLPLLCVTLLFVSCDKTPADLLLYNGMIYTVDVHFSVAEAVAIRNGLILETGPEHILRNNYKFQREEDLRGAFVYPGFIDAHAHFLALARSYQEVDLKKTASAYDMVLKVIDFQGKNDLKVIKGRGWDQNLWEDSEMPTNYALNKVFPQIPVLLRRIDGHAMLVNDIVLQKNGITPETVVEGGEILVENGKCTGVLIDNAMSLVSWPIEDHRDVSQGIREAQRVCFSLGLTALSEMGLVWPDIMMMDSLYDENTLSINMQILASDDEYTFEKMLDRGSWMKKNMVVSGFKFYADGALGSRGACLLKPYSDMPGSSGFLLSSPEEIRGKAQRVRDAGLQLCTHAIGDSANRVVLNIYRDLLATDTNHRWRIEHAQVVNSTDVERFQGTGIIPSVQPTHGTSDMLWAVNRLGKHRIADGYRYEDLRKAAGLVALGTDFPIEEPDPLGTFYAGVIRKNQDGVPEDGFQMENALSRENTLRGMTIWAAYAQFADNIYGSIEAGKQADMVVLNKDVISCSEEDLRKITVLQTYVMGNKVYGIR